MTEELTDHRRDTFVVALAATCTGRRSSGCPCARSASVVVASGTGLFVTSDPDALDRTIGASCRTRRRQTTVYGMSGNE